MPPLTGNGRDVSKKDPPAFQAVVFLSTSYHSPTISRPDDANRDKLGSRAEGLWRSLVREAE
ncbi:hypothetical protein MMC10_005742 [Thelotrema lepadinum]|nr:hypothetical protein [Thelotrema lepadinum]